MAPSSCRSLAPAIPRNLASNCAYLASSCAKFWSSVWSIAIEQAKRENRSRLTRTRHMRHPGTSLPRLRCRARPVNKKAKLCQTAKSLPTSRSPNRLHGQKSGPSVNLAARLQDGPRHLGTASSRGRKPSPSRGAEHRPSARGDRNAGARRPRCDRRKDVSQAIGKRAGTAHCRSESTIQGTDRRLLGALCWRLLLDLVLDGIINPIQRNSARSARPAGLRVQ
jgi:hypothetical protein